MNESRLIPEQEQHKKAVRSLADHLRYDLSTTEVVDYLATIKAGFPVEDWAAVRGVNTSAVSENAERAREQITTVRGDPDVVVGEDTIHVNVTDHNGNEHTCRFPQTTKVVGVGYTASLKLIYESHGEIFGYYVAEDDDPDAEEPTELETCLWADGRPTSRLTDFDTDGRWGTPEAKADAILWDAEH